MGRSTRYERIARSEIESDLMIDLTNRRGADLEVGSVHLGDEGNDQYTISHKVSISSPSTFTIFQSLDPRNGESARSSKATNKWSISPLRQKLRCMFSTDGSIQDCRRCKKSRRPIRIVLRCLGFALMFLGLIEFVVLLFGLFESQSSQDFETAYARWQRSRPLDATSHWPTDYTADIQPARCHSHNDYWRSIPLKSAIAAGCTGVEADVWLLPERTKDDLLVGHSKSSLTPQRTFRTLYIDPLVEILNKQNPNTTFHPKLNIPRNGIFDTDPSQNLVLLVDFKTDGQDLWPYVSEQLEPLRQNEYLTYFNGSSVIKGPVTVVVTGNAPFNKVVENSRYRDMFFDAPLDLLANLVPSKAAGPPTSGSTLHHFDTIEEHGHLARLAPTTRNNQGQGRSGTAPNNAAIYTVTNSYYASVSFTRSIGLLLPFMTRAQRERIRQQIQGAHKQGLKVRYWDTPAWPIGLRNYVWRVLVEEGIDYLNVDDLQGATRGAWGRPQHSNRWSMSNWSIWSRR